MKFISKSFVAFSIILCLCFVAKAQTDWTGEYFFGEDGGETAGGSKIYIAHNLTVTKDEKNLKAHIYSQGFQTSIDLYADAKAEGDKLMLYFREKGKDHFLGEFEKGDLLLTLEKREIDGKFKLLTYWDNFKPSLEMNDKSGEVYFEKVSKNEKSAIQNKWTRVEFEKTGLSVAFPPGFIVDTKKESKSKQILRIVGFQKDIEMSIGVFKDNNSSKRLKQILRRGERNYQNFEIGDFKGMRSFLVNSSDKINETVNLATKKYYYHISVDTIPSEREAATRFLLSIKIDGNSIFSGEEETNFPEENILESELRSSPEATEAHERKSNKDQDKVSFVLVSNNNLEKEETRGLTRPVIIVERPFPNLNFGSLLNIRPTRPVGTTKLIYFKVQFLANGQIGKITAFSPEEDPVTQSCLESVKKIKFIPAQIDGKNVDAEKIIEYLITIFAFPS